MTQKCTARSRFCFWCCSMIHRCAAWVRKPEKRLQRDRNSPHHGKGILGCAHSIQSVSFNICLSVSEKAFKEINVAGETYAFLFRTRERTYAIVRQFRVNRYQARVVFLTKSALRTISRCGTIFPMRKFTGSVPPQPFSSVDKLIVVYAYR